MSVGNSAGISFGGLSSGLDTASIIDSLVRPERQPISRLQQQRSQLNSMKQAYAAYRGQIQNFNSSINAFSLPGAFNPTKATTSDDASVGISTAAGATPGISQIKVKKLAQAEKLASTVQSSASSALGYSGSFTVNGKNVSVTSTDTLIDIAKKINDGKAGVTASIINGGSGNAYLTLTAEKTGLSNAINLATPETSPITAREGVLAKLGLLQRPAESATVTGWKSQNFTSASQTIASAFGIPAGSTTYQVNGTSIAVDTGTMTVQQLADRIKQVSGVDAQIVSSGGGFALEFGGPDDVETAGMDDLGLFPSSITFSYGATNPTKLVGAQDAEYTLDGLNFTNASNTITDVLPGATLTLKKADENKTIDLSITKDNDGVVQKVKDFMNAYNTLSSFVKQNSQFNADTFEAGVLFGNSVVRQVESSLSSAMFASVANLTGPYSNLTQLGLTFAENGTLQLNEDTLKTALNNNPDAVADVFRSNGRTNSADLKYVSGTNKSKPSSSTGYQVNITQAATQTQTTAKDAQSGALAASETLFFSGGVFGTSGSSVVLDAGMTQAQIVSRINADSRLSDKVTASIESGKLVIKSKSYGAASDFKVISDRASSPSTSGIGLDGESAKAVGLDVQGTINGEAASGAGQFLVGKEGNANTEGIQVQYTGSTTGLMGNVTFTQGVTNSLFNTMTGFLDNQNGLLSVSTNSLDAQVTTINERIESIQKRASAKEQSLRRQFAAMEEAINRSQQQQARLQSIRSQNA